MKTLKRKLAAVTLCVIFGSSLVVEATLVNFTQIGSNAGSMADPATYTGGGSSLGQLIPDNTASGVGYSINFGPAEFLISDIAITLNVTGGYNGDLFAYLTHGGQSAVLFNQNIGTPNSSGLSSVAFTVGSGATIHSASGTAGQALTGSYTAQDNLNVFYNTTAAGTWTLFLADLSPGDTSTLVSWDVDLTVVPEPATWTLIIFGALASGTVMFRRFSRAAL